jgi:hypothetical protein
MIPHIIYSHLYNVGFQNFTMFLKIVKANKVSDSSPTNLNWNLITDIVYDLVLFRDILTIYYLKNAIVAYVI